MRSHTSHDPPPQSPTTSPQANPNTYHHCSPLSASPVRPLLLHFPPRQLYQLLRRPLPPSRRSTNRTQLPRLLYKRICLWPIDEHLDESVTQFLGVDVRRGGLAAEDADTEVFDARGVIVRVEPDGEDDLRDAGAEKGGGDQFRGCKPVKGRKG